ncbi:hypothetical protein [Moritella sp. F3]|uniref:hypothetical protein n=1 Tax=Moritella sp. F3 TaxID=2718882 RepID=UPI0018E0EE4B|nr:hypothetical protein [Moritella sp. F3]GIC77699.1 hypothetical protein FMO001_24260 [Moritella sp. F1]GIC82112.1 hypothetical protein FMO003_23930 [Moritella sp. F3]
MHKNWITDLTDFTPINLGGHWGTKQAGFNVSLSGLIWLTDNRNFPCHRDLICGTGQDETRYSGIYSWFRGKCVIYTYPHLESVLHEPGVLKALKSLIGVHGLTKASPVISNCSREVLFLLGDE